MNWWLYKSLGATWHWYRYAIAVQRGSIHCHDLAKLENGPGLCELTHIALKGFIAKQKLENDNSLPHKQKLKTCKSK